MGLFILLALIGVPILEIAVFMSVGGQIGLVNTLAIVVLTAIIGTALLRQQGLSVLARAQESLRDNRFPLAEVFDGLCLVFAGALLLTPGFVTDGVGLLLFLPPVRFFLKRLGASIIAKRGGIHMSGGNGFNPPGGGFGGTNDLGGSNGDGVIDGDYEDVTRDAGSEEPDRRQLPKKPDNDN